MGVRPISEAESMGAPDRLGSWPWRWTDRWSIRKSRDLKSAVEPKRTIDPFTREEAADLVAITREHFPEWHAWLLCSLRTGLRLGEQRVEGKLTTPKNRQDRRVDMSLQLRALLRLWRRRQRAAWFKRGLGLPEWVFPSSTGTPLDPSNLRKVFKQMLDKAELRHRNIHGLRHTFASLLIQQGTSPAYSRSKWATGRFR